MKSFSSERYFFNFLSEAPIAALNGVKSALTQATYVLIKLMSQSLTKFEEIIQCD